MTPRNQPYPCWIAGEKAHGLEAAPVLDKFSGAPFASVAMADAPMVDRALAAGAAAAEAMRRLPAHARRDALHTLRHALEARAEEFARTITAEVGKTIRESRAEVARAIDTFRLSAEESTRITGEHLPLDTSPRTEGCEGVVRRVPVGLCSFISPFNFPLNLAAHKIGPAIAAGCPFVLKPSNRAPLAACMLGELLESASLPPGAWSILACNDDLAGRLVEDDRPRLLSFTGSPAVGWRLKARAGRKKVHLELGGVAFCIVDDTADLDRAADRIAFGAFAVAGQSCISVQRILAHASVFRPLADRIAARAARLRLGDPAEESTDLGPLISEEDARRVEAWVRDAAAAGAAVLCGGHRRDRHYEPTLVANPPPDSDLACKEVFGPVATIEPFDDFADALRLADATPFGLQAGVFTNRLDRAMLAWKELEYGAVVVNDVPTTRVDAMPYGGVKDSGLGREGARAAIAEFTEPRLLLLTGLPR